jgi:2,3-bisphosphoglycerate-independent phosphoglycerate mutase
MDPDKRWKRIKAAVDGLVGGEGENGEGAIPSIKVSYDKNVKPIIANGVKSFE